MTDATLQLAEQQKEAEFTDYLSLLKPRVMTLVVFTAFVGMCASPAYQHPFVMFVSILCIAAGGGAAGALNMWLDADIDSVMRRTLKRPIPAGKITANDAKILGFSLSGFSVVMLGLSANWLAAFLLAFTIFFYIVIYTIWLKRSTPHNIVIGGAAGAFPPIIGWAAVSGSVSLDSVVMFAMIFFWTPPHFWALALFTRSDYEDAGVPMLTVTHGRRATRNHILFYSAVLSVLTISAGFLVFWGPIYVCTAAALNVKLLGSALQIWNRGHLEAEADKFLVERKFFKLSLFYLFAHFAAILLDGLLLSAFTLIFSF